MYRLLPTHVCMHALWRFGRSSAGWILVLFLAFCSLLYVPVLWYAIPDAWHLWALD